jgi:hypothetical protein
MDASHKGGVMACDFRLSAIEGFLTETHTSLGEWSPDAIFVVEQRGSEEELLIGSFADASLVDSTRPEYGERLSPRKSPSELIARVAHELYYRFGSVAEASGWRGVLAPGSSEGDLSVVVSDLSAETDGLPWLIVVVYQRSRFFETPRVSEGRAFLIGMGVGIATLYLVTVTVLASRSESDGGDTSIARVAPSSLPHHMSEAMGGVEKEKEKEEKVPEVHTEAWFLYMVAHLRDAVTSIVDSYTLPQDTDTKQKERKASIVEKALHVGVQSRIDTVIHLRWVFTHCRRMCGIPFAFLSSTPFFPHASSIHTQ